MPGLRRPTAIAPWSCPGTALPTAGDAFVRIMSRWGRRAAALLRVGKPFGGVRDFEFQRRTPQALEIVVAPRLLTKYVHDEAAEIEQCPICGPVALAVAHRDRKSTRLNSSH